MKQLLLTALLASTSLASQAQVSSALVNGLGLGARLALGGSGSQQKPTLFVAPATFQGQEFPQKRTPYKKLPKDSQGGTEIIAIEQLLTSRYEALQADSTSVLLGLEQEKQFSRLRNNLQAFNPAWSADAYLAELDFYRQQDIIRKHRAAASAK